MSAEVLAPAMFAALAFALLLGFPVAFSVAAVAAVFGVLGIAGGHFQPAFLLAGTLRIEGFFHNDNLLAIPLFVFMGLLLERTGLAADMLRALDELLAAVRGGMAYTVVLVGASLSALTGFVSAAVIGLGLIALPALLRPGYDARLATGVGAPSGAPLVVCWEGHRGPPPPPLRHAPGGDEACLASLRDPLNGLLVAGHFVTPEGSVRAAVDVG